MSQLLPQPEYDADLEQFVGQTPTGLEVYGDTVYEVRRKQHEALGRVAKHLRVNGKTIPDLTTPEQLQKAARDIFSADPGGVTRN